MEIPKEVRFNEQGELEWVAWTAARMFLVAAGACDPVQRPMVMAEWAERGLLPTRARMLFTNGQLERDGSIPALAWKYALEEGSLDPFNGHLECVGTFASDEERLSVRARDIEVNFMVLRDLLPMEDEHVHDALDRSRALFASQHKKPSPEQAQVVSLIANEAGRKPDKARWQAFYFCVIELANEGRLNASSFESAAALSEELLTMMGDSAFNVDYIKPVVGQIFKRFVGDQRSN